MKAVTWEAHNVHFHFHKLPRRVSLFVAQVSNLLYRGFLIRTGAKCSAVCRLEVGDTADWKSALRKKSALSVV
jgi:hypothetical protein